jgi:hypothetical protein
MKRGMSNNPEVNQKIMFGLLFPAIFLDIIMSTMPIPICRGGNYPLLKRKP